MNTKYESLQQKVVRAAWELDAGTPLKDSLTEYEIMEAILMLADVLTTLGVTTDEHDGQPDEAQEWQSFDPDC